MGAILAIVAATLLAASVAACSRPDSPSPKVATASKPADAEPLTRLPDWAVPESYNLSIKSNPAQPGYTGKVLIVLDLKQASDHLWLHGKDLKVDSVTVTDATGKAHTGEYDGSVSKAATQAGVARIDFGESLQPQKLKLAIDFSAPYNQTLQGYYKVIFAGDAYAMTQMEPISARFAFPDFDEPGFKVPLTLSLTIPDADKAVANAPESSSKPVGQAWKTVTFEPTKPLPTYLYAWAVGPWDIVDGPSIAVSRWRAQPVPVRGIATKGNGPEMERALAMAPGILEAEEKYYGFGYPFGKLDLAALPDFSAGAMENAGLVTYRDWLLLLDKDSTPGAVRSTFNDEAHELAHQWTGDTVTLKWWNDIWLNEAFATWMQQKVEQEIHPEWRGDLERIEGGQGAMRDDSLVSARMIRQPITSNGDIETAFDGITYQKGAAVIGMFEHFVEPAVFQKGMQAYIKAHAFGNADADDLIDAIAIAAGKGVAFKKAFKSFLDQNGVPMVSTKLDCNGKSGAVLSISQSRYLPLGSTGDPARVWGIPVCVRLPHGTQCQVLAGKTADMKVAGGQCPAWYLPNADGDGYYRYVMDKADRAALTKVIGQRGDGEQLAYADSVRAAFQRGDLDAGEALDAMHELARSKVRQVALAPLDTVGWIYDHEAQTDTQKAAVRGAVEKAYLPRLHALGYHRRRGESADAALMRTSLAEELALEFKVPQVRTELLKQGEAALHLGKGGLPDLAAADPDLLGSALSVAVEERGKPAVDELIAAIPKTTDPVKRNAMLAALSHARGAETAAARNFALSKDVKVGEMRMILGGGRDTVAQRDALWQWFTSHYEQIVARTGSFSGGQLPMLVAGGSCSNAEAQRLETYFKPKLGDVAGVTRGLAQAHEAIILCTALRAHQDPKSIAP